MTRFCALSRNFVKVCLQDTSWPHCSKTLRSLCLILKERCKIKQQTQQQSSTGSFFPLCVLFIRIFPLEPSEKAWKRELGAQNTHCFWKKNISFIQRGINEIITKLSWKIEENRMSERFYFSNKKKEHRKWNPLYGLHKRSLGSLYSFYTMV